MEVTLKLTETNEFQVLAECLQLALTLLKQSGDDAAIEQINSKLAIADISLDTIEPTELW